MKKLLLLFVTFLFTTISISAQDLYLSWEGTTIGETLTVWGDPSTSEFKFHAVVHNNTVNGINIKVRRTEIALVDATQNSFRWGFDFPPHMNESPNPRLILAGEQSSDDEFVGYYSPSTKIGTSTVEYMFFNQDNEDQNVKVTVKYWASPEGIAEEAMKGGSVSAIYPNPANQTVNLDYQLTNEVTSARVKIVNLLGAVVQEANIDVDETRIAMDISKLETGIYFYTMLINDDVYKTMKFVIQK